MFECHVGWYGSKNKRLENKCLKHIRPCVQNMTTSPNLIVTLRSLYDHLMNTIKFHFDNE